MNRVDKLFGIIADGDEGLELNHNKQYIGLRKNGRPDNYIIFEPRKKAGHVILSVAIEPDPTLTRDLDDQGFDQMGYEARYGYYRLRIKDADLAERRSQLEALIRRAQELR